MTIHELARIACRYQTAMADAMIEACKEKAAETGERIDIPEWRIKSCRPRLYRRVDDDEMSDEDWRRMCEGNRESRAAHVNSR